MQRVRTRVQEILRLLVGRRRMELLSGTAFNLCREYTSRKTRSCYKLHHHVEGFMHNMTCLSYTDKWQKLLCGM